MSDQDDTRDEAARETPAPYVAGERPYNALPIPKAIAERPTEDDLAQAALGGPRGHEDLKPQKLTRTEAEQNLPTDEPGHVV